MNNHEIIAEKLEQCTQILEELDIDVWLTLTRETAMLPEPVLELILGHSVTWQSAFLLTKSGQHTAIIGRYDAENVRNLNVYSKVIAYDKGIARHLMAAIEQLAPRQIAVNFSKEDVAADGLSYGNWLNLQNYLRGTPYVDRLISAEQVISALRGRKTKAEIKRVKTAVHSTEAIIDKVIKSVRPGMTQKQIASLFQDEIEARGFGYSWDKAFNPIVTCGPNSAIGHVTPGNIVLKPGDTFHIDIGVKQQDYCSDIQRMWYVLKEDETEAPADVQRAFDTVLTAIKAGERALKPGVPGWKVDAAAREIIVDAGYPEYLHAFGHLLGRSAHDGAAVLGPRWERYEGLSDRLVEINNIFTLELHVPVPNRGIMSLEEDVLVTEDEVVYLTTPQTELAYITS